MMRVFNIFGFLRKGLRKPIWLPVMAILLLFSFQSASAVMIDNFNVDQTEIEAAGPAPTSDSSVQPGAATSIIGGNRYMQVDLSQGLAGESVTAEVLGGDFSNSFDSGTRGQVLLSWSGDGNPASFNLGGNLCTGSQFDVEFLTNDHTVNYTMNVYTSGGAMSSYTMSVPAGIVSSTIVTYPFASFAPAANFDCSDVGRIEMEWDTAADDQDALDMSLNQIEVPDEIAFKCDSKTFDGQKTLVLPGTTTFPHVITASVSFSNTGTVPIPAEDLTVTDTLDAGLTYLGPSTQTAGPAGLIIEPDINGQELTWTSQVDLPAMTTVVFEYDVQIDALAEGQTLTNDVVVDVEGLPSSNLPACEAAVTIQREVVPAMNEWGALLAVLGVILLGIYLYRRRATRA